MGQFPNTLYEMPDRDGYGPVPVPRADIYTTYHGSHCLNFRPLANLVEHKLKQLPNRTYLSVVIPLHFSVNVDSVTRSINTVLRDLEQPWYVKEVLTYSNNYKHFNYDYVGDNLGIALQDGMSVAIFILGLVGLKELSGN